MTTTAQAVNRFIGARKTKMVPFMDAEIEICKLSINQVLHIQAVTAENENDPKKNIFILSEVIRAGALELREIPQPALQDFPMEELASLSDAIMVFSGLNPAA